MVSFLMGLTIGVLSGIWEARYPIIRRWRRKLIVDLQEAHEATATITYLILSFVLAFATFLMVESLIRLASLALPWNIVGVTVWIIGITAIVRQIRKEIHYGYQLSNRTN